MQHQRSRRDVITNAQMLRHSIIVVAVKTGKKFLLLTCGIHSEGVHPPQCLCCPIINFAAARLCHIHFRVRWMPWL